MQITFGPEKTFKIYLICSVCVLYVEIFEKALDAQLLKHEGKNQ